jgi:hypothetical protein
LEEKMNPAHKSNEHHFYPEGYNEKFYLKFQTTPSHPLESEDETVDLSVETEKENTFKSKTWTKTTDSWV